jgi:hypothetical protein
MRQTEPNPLSRSAGVSHGVKRDEGRILLLGCAIKMAFALDIHHYQRNGQIPEQTLSGTAL